METLKGKILPDGRFKELNPLIEPKWYKVAPNEGDYRQRRDYREAENNLRTFEIEDVMCNNCEGGGCTLCGNDGVHNVYSEGTTHTAQLLPNGKVRIC